MRAMETGTRARQTPAGAPTPNTKQHIAILECKLSGNSFDLAMRCHGTIHNSFDYQLSGQLA